jgi:hypothetical protein
MANLQDRSTPTEARWKVRWTESRARPERSHTFTSPPARRGQSDAEKAGRRLKAYLDLMGLTSGSSRPWSAPASGSRAYRSPPTARKRP